MRTILIAAALATAAPATAQTQLQMNQSAAAQDARANAALKMSYNRLIDRLDRPSRNRLRASQSAWLTFRDKHCASVAGGVEGGSAAPMIAAACMTELAQDRIRQLDRLANCPEGDLSCPR